MCFFFRLSLFGITMHYWAHGNFNPVLFFVVIMFVLDKAFALVVRYISLVSTEWFSFVSVQNIHRSCWVLLERFLPYLRALVLIRHLLINTSQYSSRRISYLFSEREGPLEHPEKTRNLSMA